MPPTSRLYDGLSQFLSQCQSQWQDARHLQTLCWMIVGMLQSESVHLNEFGVHVHSRATNACVPSAPFSMAVKSANRRNKCSSCSDWAGALGLGQRAAVSELGYHDGVELFLHRLGGSGLPGTDSARGMAGGGTGKQYGAAVDDSTGATTSSTGDANWR